MTGVSKIVDSEYEIMKVLWNEQPLTANEIYNSLAEKKTWSKSTVVTLVNRLVEKGALSATKRGVYFYTPVVSEAEYTKYHADSMLQKLFGGSAKNLLAYFCSDDRISLEDLDELRQIVERKEC